MSEAPTGHGGPRQAAPDDTGGGSPGYDAPLRDGETVHIRPLRGRDRAALHDLVERTSEESAYLRFFAGGRATAHLHMERLTAPGHRGRAFVAVLGGRVVGIAEHVPAEDLSDTDVAVLVDDRVHGRGLGTLLLERLAIDAAGLGVAELVADVLPVNRMMLIVLDDLGLPVTREFTGGEVRVRIDLRAVAALADATERRRHGAGPTGRVRRDGRRPGHEGRAGSPDHPARDGAP
ncbi:GNAT family N-acetyltransferase [Streptosporangium sp. NPDC048047]|uniref:GNAT family N-acetyltransferase n=1 Tax=Streptosporangium sp. NPDC048047 TaxID=3155748 RepID=UPI003438891F